MKISKTAAWSIGTAVLCVVLLAAAYLLLVEPQRAVAAETRAQTDDVRQQNLQLADRIDQLRIEYANLPRRKAELVGIRQALPEATALAGLLAEIDDAAVAAPVALDSMTTSEPTAVVDATAVAPVATAGPATPEAGVSGTTQPAPPAIDGAAPPAGGTVPGLPVLAAVPISLTSTGDYFGMAAFLKTLQTGIDRALIIDTVSIDMVAANGAGAVTEGSAGTAGSAVTATITGRVFVFVDPASLPAGATPAVPATPTATTPDVPVTTPGAAPAEAPGTVPGGTE